MPFISDDSAKMSVPAKAPQAAADPPAADVDALVDATFTASQSQQALDAAYAIARLLCGSASGFRSLRRYRVARSVASAAVDKKSGARRESAMLVLGAIFELLPRSQPLAEAVFLAQGDPPANAEDGGGWLGLALDALADKGAVVRDSARYAIDALYANLREEAITAGLVPALISYLGRPTGKWQGVTEAYKLLEKAALRAASPGRTPEDGRRNELLRDSMGKQLRQLIPVVEAGMHDLKNDVVKQAIKTMNALTQLLSNDDVAPRIPLLVKTMENPDLPTLQKAILALSQTTFVAVVTSPVLALLTPLLERSLNSPTTPQEVLRQTVVVVENLTKLVHDPAEARTFLPKLRPGVQGVLDRASLPEVRELAASALSVIKHAMGEDVPATTDGAPVAGEGARAVPKTTPEETLVVLEAQVKAHGGLVNSDDAAFWDSVAKNYISEMVTDDSNCRQIERIPDSVAPYLEVIVAPGQATAIAEALRTHFAEEDARKYGVPEPEDPNEVEIVNATFSLAYGGMLLLSHTNLRMLKGHRYGLCGRNGSGKSTLMRSIAEGKLEGFPPPEELKTCFVEHNQGESADSTILEYVSHDPAIAGQSIDRISQVLAEVGFTAGPEGRQSQTVGSLSGGWKMKLALARAMLMGADVFLLDEPTNHLDVANVKWLQDYLKSHTEITSMIVSHDSGFLDEVCTDILHYEQKKLVPYKGNLAE